MCLSWNCARPLVAVLVQSSVRTDAVDVVYIVLCSDTPAVPVAELPLYLAALPAWQLAEDSKSISRHFVAKNFVAGMSCNGKACSPFAENQCS